ncbi:MAG: metallophosphoesterase [Phycisphaerae bacterium]|nr:metallophosphoesterase [Phycisphaerae bacterium]
MPQTIIIGDIHGCYAELRDLLDKVAPSADDRIIALGDIVDRGPDSEKVLEFFRDTPNATSLMGNHEHKHVRSARGEVPPALSQIIVKLQLEDAYPQWAEFMAGFSSHIELPEAILVHGFFEPGVPLTEQDEEAMIGTVSGEERVCEKYSNYWYECYTGPKPLIAGHHSYLRNGQPVIRDGLFYGIDTGCAYGGRLTALVLPEFRIVSVPSRRDYWAEQRGGFDGSGLGKAE